MFSQKYPLMSFAEGDFPDSVYYMSNDPRAALANLTNALEEHLTAIVNRRGEHDPAIDNAYVAVANAFERYEEALFDEYEEVTPLDVYIDDEDELDDIDEDFEDDEDDLEYEDLDEGENSRRF